MQAEQGKEAVLQVLCFLIIQEINDVGNCQSIFTIVIVNGEIVTGEADACRPPIRLFFPSQENPRGGQEEIRLLHIYKMSTYL